MKKKKYEILILLVFIILLLSYAAVISHGIDLSITGLAGQLPDLDAEPTIHAFLASVDNYPDQHMIVIKEHAAVHELEAAKEISDRFGIRIKKDINVADLKSNLLFIGRGLLSDKIFEDSSDDTFVELVDNNLLIIGDIKSMPTVTDAIVHYNDQRNFHSPGRVTFGSPFFYILIPVIVIPLFLVILEIIRKKSIARSKELKIEHKIDAIENYIVKFEHEGYSEDQLKKWLDNFGYDPSLIDKAIKRVHSK